MTVLVTGGFGMLGAAAVRALLRMGEPVVVLARSDHRQRLADLDGEFVAEIGDVTDLDTVYRVMIDHGVDRVCHAAAALPWGGDNDPKAAYRNNVVGTVNLLSAAGALGARRFVFTSAKAVYAAPSGEFAAPRLRPVTEDHERSPGDLYGATKLAAELMVDQFAGAAGMSAAILRFATTYGPGKGTARHGGFGDVSRIVEAAVAGGAAPVAADLDAGMDCVYVDDAGRGVALAVMCERGGVEAYHIATGGAVTIADVVDAARVATGRRVEVVPGPCEPRRHMVLGVEKAERELGFRARFDLRSAVGAYVAALRAAASPEGPTGRAASGGRSQG